MKLIINNLVIIIVTINLNLCLFSVCVSAYEDKYSLYNGRPKESSEGYVYPSSLTNEEANYYDSNKSNEDIDDLGIKLVGGGKLVKIKENRQCKNNYIGLKQHPRNKQFYYICQRNRIVLGQCQDNKIFNDTYKCCVSQNHCAPNKVDQNDWKYKFNITHCYVPGIFPIQGQSRFYYKCVYLNGRFLQKIRKCPRGTLFDTTTGTCVERVKSSPPNQEVKFQLTTPVYTRPNHYETAIENSSCSSPDTYSADENSGYYYKCCLKSDGEYYQVKLKCPSGKSFDSTSKECVTNSDLDYYTDFPQPSIAKMIRHKKKSLFPNLPKMFTMQKRRMAKRIQLLDDIFDNSDETKEETVKTTVNSKFCGCCDVNKYGDKFSSENESGPSYGNCVEYVPNKGSNSRRPKCSCTCHNTKLTTQSEHPSTPNVISTLSSETTSMAVTTPISTTAVTTETSVTTTPITTHSTITSLSITTTLTTDTLKSSLITEPYTSSPVTTSAATSTSTTEEISISTTDSLITSTTSLTTPTISISSTRTDPSTPTIETARTASQITVDTTKTPSEPTGNIDSTLSTPPSTETSTLTVETTSNSISDSSSSASTTNSISNTDAPTTVSEKPSTTITEEGSRSDTDLLITSSVTGTETTPTSSNIYPTISTTTISPLTTTMETTISALTFDLSTTPVFQSTHEILNTTSDSSETSTSTQDSIKTSTPTITTLTTPVSSLISDQYILTTSTTYESSTSDTISTSEKPSTSSTRSTLQEPTYTIETSPTTTNKTNPIGEIKITMSNTEPKIEKPKTNATSLMDDLIANSINFNLALPDILPLSMFEYPRINRNSNYLENTTLNATVSEQEGIPNLEHVTTKTANALKFLFNTKSRRQENAAGFTSFSVTEEQTSSIAPLTKATFETTKIASETFIRSTNSDLPITKPMPTTGFPEATAMALISENEIISPTTLSPSATFLTTPSKNDAKTDESISIPDLISNMTEETNLYMPGNTENQMIANEPNSSDFSFTLSEEETTENETASAFMTYPELPEITTSEDITHFSNKKNSELNKQTNKNTNNEFDLEDFSEMNFNSTKASRFTSSQRTPPLREEGSNDETGSDLSDYINYNTYLTTNTPVYNTMPKVTDANFEFQSIESLGTVMTTDKDSPQTVGKFNQNEIHSKQSAQNKHLLEITESELIGNFLSLNSDQDKLCDQMSSTVSDSSDSTSPKMIENYKSDTNESTKETTIRSQLASDKNRLASKPSPQLDNKIETGKTLNKTVDLTRNDKITSTQLPESDADASLEEEVSNLEIDEFQHSNNYDELFSVPLPRCTCQMESIDNQSESSSNSKTSDERCCCCITDAALPK